MLLTVPHSVHGKGKALEEERAALLNGSSHVAHTNAKRVHRRTPAVHPVVCVFLFLATTGITAVSYLLSLPDFFFLC